MGKNAHWLLNYLKVEVLAGGLGEQIDQELLGSEKEAVHSQDCETPRQASHPGSGPAPVRFLCTPGLPQA